MSYRCKLLFRVAFHIYIYIKLNISLLLVRDTLAINNFEEVDNIAHESVCSCSSAPRSQFTGGGLWVVGGGGWWVVDGGCWLGGGYGWWVVLGGYGWRVMFG